MKYIVEIDELKLSVDEQIAGKILIEIGPGGGSVLVELEEVEQALSALGVMADEGSDDE